MKVTGRLLSVADCAFLLAQNLGTGRQWVDAMNDMRIGRGGILGVANLLPVAHTPSRSSTPVYRPSDVLEFIRQVRHVSGTKRPYVSPGLTFTYEPINPNTPSQYWRQQPAILAVP